MAGNLFRMALLGADGSAGAAGFASAAQLLTGVAGGQTVVRATITAAVAAGVGVASDVVDVEADAPMEVSTQGGAGGARPP